MSDYSIKKEAERLFRDVLLKDARLQLPAKVTAVADKTSFDVKDTLDTPFMPMPLKVTETSAALWALAATFGNAIVAERLGGKEAPQTVKVNTDLASLFLISCTICRVDGEPINKPDLAKRYLRYDLGRSSDPYRRLCTSVYPTRDGRWFHLHGSMNADRSLTMVGLPLSDASLTAQGEDAIVAKYTETVAKFDAEWLDVESNEHLRQAGTIIQTEAEFRASPQGKAIADDGLYILTNEAPSLPPVPYPTLKPAADGSRPSARPLEGLKMLDISRVIAAPTIAKLAAAFGATVLRVSCDTQPDMGPLLVEGNLGKYDTTLNLKTAEGRNTLKKLLADADIVLDGYRPGALERLGFGTTYLHALAKRRGRGLVVVREDCYGWHGPRASRAGWQQISDCTTGVSDLEGKFLGLNEPVVPPLPNSDYQTGLAGLVGIMAAVDRRATEGGSYTVDVSLNQYNQWLLAQGAYAPATQAALLARHPNLELRHYDDMIRMVVKLMKSLASTAAPQVITNPAYYGNIACDFGAEDGRKETLTYVLPAATYDGATRLGYDVGSCFLGTHAAEWPAA